MRIIKEGQLPEGKVYVHTCVNCRTLFGFLAKEGKITYDQRDGDFISVKCPFCDKTCNMNL